VLRPSYGLAEHVVGVSTRVGASTEALVTSKRRYGNGQELMSVGTRWQENGVDLRVVDRDTLKEVEAGQEGEVWVHSRSVALGYWGLHELTAAVFKGKLASDTSGKVFH
jgi:acyl-CoA synthetase (AMP-forming)/AMP-acid ligase II